MKRIFFLVLIFLSFSYSGLSQGLTKHNWNFGNSTLAIRFNRVDNTAVLINNQGVPFGNGASVVASSAINGNVLFYSDGTNVYDISNAQMPNGFGLNANSAGNQTVAAAPIPGEPDKYYIFTNTSSFQTGGAIFYSVVDMNLFGNALFPTPALGDVEPTKNIAVPGLTNTSEAMLVIPHADENGTYWLITQDNNTSTYQVTFIDVSRSFVTNSFTLAAPPLTAANFAYHEGSGKIAVSPQSSGDNLILMDFDNTTGVLSFDRELLNSGVLNTTNNQAIYDAEFSVSGDFLYVSRHGDTGITADVLRFDLTNLTSTSESILPSTIFRSYGLQMAPDTAIYHLYQSVDSGPFLLGRISQTDSLIGIVNYEAEFFNTTNFNGRSLPAFSPAQLDTLIVDFEFDGTCSGVPTSFYPTVIPGADSLSWNFGDGAGFSNGWSPVYTYQSGNVYNVTLTAFLNGRSEQVTKPVTITQFDLEITLPADTVACSCELPISDEPTKCAPFFSVTAQIQGGTPVSTVWSNGQTGNTLAPDSAGYYYVVVTDASGCSAYAGVNITEYGVQDQRANVWYFGQNAGIDFNQLPPIPLDDSNMNAPEGCSAISDRNGNIIFYTDGQNVYNKNHVLIADDIGGDPGSSQSVVIVPVPGDETLYYIFTTMEVHGSNVYRMSYSLFDLKENNGDGDVVQRNNQLFSRSTERITGTANWVIAHEYGNNTFRAYPITMQGIGQPVLTSIGSDHVTTSEINGRGYMKLGNDFKLAVALSEPGVYNVVEVFDFDPTTGRLSNFRRLDTGETDGQVYGVEFSPAGNKLFASIQGTPSKLIEFAFDSLGIGYIKPPPIDAPGLIGALQTGPDGQIYIAFDNRNTLGTIQANEDTTQVSFVNFDGFALAGGTQSRLGLPNFIQNLGTPVQPPGISASGLCFGSPTTLTGTGTSSIDEYAWFIRDAANQLIHSTNDQQFDFEFPAPGDYNLTLGVTNRCGLDTTLVQLVTIFDSPPLPLAEYYNDPSFNGFFLCDGPVTVDAYPNDVNGISYLWTSGDTTRTVTFTQQQFFDVTVTDANGCSSTEIGVVSDNRPQLAIGPDFTICQDEVVADLNAQQAPTTPVNWLLNGANPSTGSLRSVSTGTPGLFSYTVEVTDPLSGCVGRDTINITVNPSPLFTATPTNTTGCGNPDGSIAIEITSSGSYSYLIVGPETRNGLDQIGPSAVPISEINLPAGAYTVIVTDDISACSNNQAAGINDSGAFTIDAISISPPVCDEIPIDVVTTGLVFPATYQVINVNTNAIAASGPATTSTFNTDPVPPGDYIIEITGGGCLNTETIAFVADAAVDYTLTFDGCANPATVEVEATSLSIPTADALYAWTGPGIDPPGANDTRVINFLTSGNYTVTVSDNSNNFCPSTQSIDVLIDNQTTVSVVQTDPCVSNVTLTANPSGSGNFTYQWSRNGVPVPSGGGRQIVAGLDDNGATYTVTARNSQSGCNFTSDPFIVEVVGPVQLNLSSTIACDNGEPFTLTANTNISTASFIWSFNNSVIPNQNSNELTDTRPGTYRVELTEGSCNSTSSLTISLLPAYDSDLPNRAIICNDPDNTDPDTSQLELDPGSGFQQFNWFFNDNPFSNAPVVIVNQPGEYRAELINDFGCETIEIIEVINDCQPKIIAPNAFRPGGLNTDFFVYSFFITNEFQIFIYNRWGEMIYQSNQRNFTWNGGYNNDINKPLPGGQYAYVVRYISVYRPERGIQEQRGSVLLLR